MTLLDDYINKVLDDRAKALDTLVQKVLESFNMTLEEFVKDYIIDLFPIEIETYVLSEMMEYDQHRFQVTQKYRIRRKTKEEKEYDESQLNQVSSLEDSGSDGSATPEVRS